MARFGGQTRVPSVAVAAGVAETILQLVAPTLARVVLTGYNMNGEGTSNTETPGLWDLMRQSTAGTSVAGTTTKEDDSISDALQSTSRITFTVEPTGGDLARLHTVHPQTSLYVKEQYTREKIIGFADRMGLRANYAQAQNVGVSMDFEE